MTRRALLLAAASALSACGSSERLPSAPPPITSPEAAVSAAPAPGSPIPADTHQLVTAIVPDWDAPTAELRLWLRDGDRWRAAGPAWPAVIGRGGAAWGIGLHGDGAPANRTGPVKREGDGKSPAGVFALAGTYGYAARPPAGAGLPYTPVDATWKCVDDPASRHYNQILDARTTAPDWASAEDMRRPDALYAWVVEVAHNATRAPGHGSCIFLHVWGGPDDTTSGCTAMDEARLAALLAQLSPAATPTFVLLPRAEYDALAPAWNLPR